MAQRLLRYAILAGACIIVLMLWRMGFSTSFARRPNQHFTASQEQLEHLGTEGFMWTTLKETYPVTSFRPLPHNPKRLPSIQADFRQQTPAEKEIWLQRQTTIKDSFLRSWKAYKEHAWLKDEVTPISAKSKDTFGGWGATLIDSLDTLWIMDLKDELKDAIDAVDQHISFENTQADEINVFETTIRFLGGLLSAFELTSDIRLLSKAKDVGDLLYKAFDTPNHLPVLRWNLHTAADGEKQVASNGGLLAEAGSLCMEFTRLSLLTRDPKYFDATDKITQLLADAQMQTKLPGLWPIVVDMESGNFDAGDDYALGGMADSTFEYLPKMIALLGDEDGSRGRHSRYWEMYTASVKASTDHLFYRAMNPGNEDLFFAGVLHKGDNDAEETLEASTGHLNCFLGGMLALGGKLTSSQEQLDQAGALTRGCIWAYNSTATGVMPETIGIASCPLTSTCKWDEAKWHQAVRLAQSEVTGPQQAIEDQRLPPGFTKIRDARYILRPEAIESVFIMFRTTGDSYWRDRAWEMWEAIDRLTRTDLANSAVWDVNPEDPDKVSYADSMESFWMGETLKYFFLTFSDPELISLDEWVFNTEAHPLRRLKS